MSDHHYGIGEEVNINDDDDVNNVQLPAGVVSHKGWGGEELELYHQMQNRSASGEGKAKASFVDLDQFRNTDVNKGYQAKHVIRQQTAGDGGDSGGRVQDVAMRTLPSSRERSGTTTTTATTTARGASEKSGRKQAETADEKVDRYLKSAPMREFRRQLEEMQK